MPVYSEYGHISRSMLVLRAAKVRIQILETTMSGHTEFKKLQFLKVDIVQGNNNAFLAKSPCYVCRILYIHNFYL